MRRGARQPQQPSRAAILAAAEWLREASACLEDPSRPLPEPPSEEFRSTYQKLVERRDLLETTQQELIQCIQMQSLQTVGSILAHDLHNLSLRLAVLSQNLGQFYGDPDFLQSAKRILDDTVERMQSLVDGFRERQETIIVKILADPNEIMHTVVRQCNLSNLEGIELREEYSHDVNRIWADPFYLANAFRIMVENAVQAMPQGGTLWLRTTSARNGGAVVEIEDTGVGMTDDFMRRELFAPFRTGKGRGLGLGMYICRHIIGLHDGQMEVRSRLGEGTRFRLIFPSGQEHE
ncbi:MAG TPA: HAMP domain-containing sensor histidine kinase [Candidatus Nitrosotenuis sp.]|nr:HAMP domain-containing sensor histidine kinase [Candidatus Nitrosotenuis sp.]